MISRFIYLTNSPGIPSRTQSQNPQGVAPARIYPVLKTAKCTPNIQDVQLVDCPGTGDYLCSRRRGPFREDSLERMVRLRSDSGFLQACVYRATIGQLLDGY